MGRPHHLLAVLHHLHREILVLAVVAGRDTLIDGLGIDEELEGGSRLPLGCHLIIFPRVEVDVAHPGLDMAVLRFHRHEAAMHEAHHVADGVHRRQFLLHAAFLIVEHFHRMGQVQVVIDGILVAVELLGEILVDRLSLGDILDEVLDLHVVGILPGVDGAPVAVEGLLQLLHLLVGSLLGILLHAGVDGGVDLQSLGVEGVAVVVVVLAPALQVVGHGLAEIVGVAVVDTLDAVVELDLEFLQRVALCLREMSVLLHEVEHDVAALQRIVGIDEGIIECGGLEHAHEDGGILGCEILRCAAEVGLTGGLDAKGIGAEIDRVGILRENLLLGEEELELVGRDPLLALHDEHLDAGDIAQ